MGFYLAIKKNQITIILSYMHEFPKHQKCKQPDTKEKTLPGPSYMACGTDTTNLSLEKANQCSPKGWAWAMTIKGQEKPLERLESSKS